MRGKNSILSLGIVALLLVLSVGYAVVSNVTIHLTGTAIAGSQLDAEIIDVQTQSSINGKTVDFSHQFGADNLSDTFTVDGIELNETVTITYTIRSNETDVDAILESQGVLTNSNSEYFEASYNISDSYTKLYFDDYTMKVKIIIKLKKTPVSENDSSTTIGVNFKVKATEATYGGGSA